MLPDVKQRTIKPLITGTIAPGATVMTDEYDIYVRLPEWGYGHKTVCHGSGEFARDEDGDGLCEIHVNTIEGFWSLLRSWLRPPWRDLAGVAAALSRFLRVRPQRPQARESITRIAAGAVADIAGFSC
ncbi:MAG TPA: transposase [Blastocatellia bacterium]|nr:transposase [Blastocatellia bacterium]